MTDVSNFFGDVSDSAGDVLEEMSGALNSDCMNQLGDAALVSKPVSVLDMVRDPSRLETAHGLSIATAKRHAKAWRLADKAAKEGGDKVLVRYHRALYRQATLVSNAIGALRGAFMMARASANQVANCAVGVQFSFTGQATYSAMVDAGTATLGAPISGSPWSITAILTDLTAASNFLLTKFVPTTEDVVLYGDQNLSYNPSLSPQAVQGLPMHLFAIQSFGLAINPTWRLAPWELPGYAFGPAATLIMGAAGCAGTSLGMTMLILMQCDPCHRDNAYEDWVQSMMPNDKTGFVRATHRGPWFR